MPCISFRFVLGTSIWSMTTWAAEELTLYFAWNKGMMVKLTVISGSSKVYASIWNLNTVSCLILVPRQKIMLFLSFTNIWKCTRCAEGAVVKLKSTFKTLTIIARTLLDVPNSMNINWVTPQIKHAKVSLDLTLCCLVRIVFSDGKLSRKDLWMHSSSW